MKMLYNPVQNPAKLILHHPIGIAKTKGEAVVMVICFISYVTKYVVDIQAPGKTVVTENEHCL